MTLKTFSVIKIKGPYSFSIGCDTTNFGKFGLSGIVNEIKKEKIINFVIILAFN